MWRDRNPGGRAQRESGRETEGDRRRKSLRHGWARLPGDGSLSGKALKFETATSELFPPWEVEERLPWIVHSSCGGISSRKHLLSSSFLLILGIPALQRRVDINHCTSAESRRQMLQWEREQLTSKREALSALTTLYVNIGILHGEERCRQQSRGQPLHWGYCEGFNFFFLPVKTDA